MEFLSGSEVLWPTLAVYAVHALPAERSSWVAVRHSKVRGYYRCRRRNAGPENDGPNSRIMTGPGETPSCSDGMSPGPDLFQPTSVIFRSSSPSAALSQPTVALLSSCCHLVQSFSLNRTA